MNLTIVLDGLQQDLQRLSELGDERSAQVAQRLGEALGSNLRLKLLDLLSQAAVELSSKLPSGHVEVRLAGQEPELVFVDAPGESAGNVAGEELSARISLRLPEALKAAVEKAADREASACDRAGGGVAPRARRRQAPVGLRPELGGGRCRRRSTSPGRSRSRCSSRPARSRSIRPSTAAPRSSSSRTTRSRSASSRRRVSSCATTTSSSTCRTSAAAASTSASSSDAPASAAASAARPARASRRRRSRPT